MGAFHAGLIWMRVPDHPLADVLTLTDRAILSVLFSFAYSDDEPRAFASAAKIAARAGCDRRTVQRALDRLEGFGLILGEHRHRQPTIWAPSDAIHPARTSGTESLGGGTESQGLRQKVAQQAAQSRSVSGTESHQLTEGTFRPNGRKRSDPSAGRAGARSASATRASVPAAWNGRGLPPDVTPTISVEV